jgi:hypothetical protein
MPKDTSAVFIIIKFKKIQAGDKIKNPSRLLGGILKILREYLLGFIFY